MPVKITLIGLGQIGASMGLALGAHKEYILRVGHDLKPKIEHEALEKGAVDQAVHNLPAAVREARLVILSLPLDQIKETLGYIAKDLENGTVVLDTAPVKSEIFRWMKEILPKECHYVGLAPALNPTYLHSPELGLNAARADLFHKGVVLIDAPPGTPEQAVTLASDFVRLLGATPLLADPAESDGIMTAIHLLPQLAGAALLNASVDQPGWLERRKLAGRPFASVTGGFAYQDEIGALKLSVMQNRTNNVYALDVLIAALTGLRNEIESGDERGVEERLKNAWEGHKRWMQERYAADWREETSPPMDVPSFAERLFGTAIAKPKR